jgi:peptidoglycan/LPS O-acetylase OafA/YrhL
MPLDRANMTVASRIMLPAYVVAFSWIGLNWLITPLERLTESPGLRYLDMNFGLRALGLCLILAGLLIAVALATKRRDMARYALTLAGIGFALLLAAFLLAPFFSDTSPSAGAWPFLGLAACRASYKSVTVHEVS